MDPYSIFVAVSFIAALLLMLVVGVLIYDYVDRNKRKLQRWIGKQ